MRGKDVIEMFTDYFNEISDGHVVEGKLGAIGNDLTTIQIGMTLALCVNEIVKSIVLDLEA